MIGHSIGTFIPAGSLNDFFIISRHIPMSVIVRWKRLLLVITDTCRPRVLIAKYDDYGLIGMIAIDYRISYELVLISCCTVTFVACDKVVGSSLKNMFASLRNARALGATVQSVQSQRQPMASIRTPCSFLLSWIASQPSSILESFIKFSTSDWTLGVVPKIM